MVETDFIVGPGQRCVYCRGEYGGHTKQCSVPKQEAAALKKRQTALGKKFREILESKNDLELGKLLLTISIKYDIE